MSQYTPFLSGGAYSNLNLGAQGSSTGIFSKLGDALSSQGFANFGQGLSGAAAIGTFGISVWQTINAQKNAKKQLELAEKQFNVENERYNALESERKKNNEHFSSAFADWSAQDAAKNNMADLPTNRV